MKKIIAFLLTLTLLLSFTTVSTFAATGASITVENGRVIVTINGSRTELVTNCRSLAFSTMANGETIVVMSGGPEDAVLTLNLGKGFGENLLVNGAFENVNFFEDFNSTFKITIGSDAKLKKLNIESNNDVEIFGQVVDMFMKDKSKLKVGRGAVVTTLNGSIYFGLTHKFKEEPLLTIAAKVALVTKEAGVLAEGVSFGKSMVAIVDGDTTNGDAIKPDFNFVTAAEAVLVTKEAGVLAEGGSFGNGVIAIVGGNTTNTINPNFNLVTDANGLPVIKETPVLAEGGSFGNGVIAIVGGNTTNTINPNFNLGTDANGSPIIKETPVLAEGGSFGNNGVSIVGGDITNSNPLEHNILVGIGGGQTVVHADLGTISPIKP